ncbi:MAG: aspartate aminotransferase family protein [Rhodospirillales bacterium]|jgi:2,2-dialkylglycine decarboxylase (pyruvate)|nr:aspartate aminotransferase family protein [Rhodospirillales bacterium]
MRQSEVKGILDRWVIGTSGRSYMAGLENRPVIARAEGSTVYDTEGRAYLDFGSGQMAAALGHNHPHILAAMERSAATILHSTKTFLNVDRLRLHEKLGELLTPPLQKSLFLVSGSDAVEAAVDLARRATGGSDVLGLHTGLHGSTSFVTRSLSFVWSRRHHVLNAPATSAIFAPYCYRCPLAMTFPVCEIRCLTASMELADANFTAPPAAVIVEPVLSAGGVVEPPPGYLQALRDACDQRGMLLIFDESQAGLGKTGRMWAHQHSGVVPDIMVVSKHFGGGLPISAVCASAEVAERAVANGFFATRSHAADPVLCAAGLASLEVVVEDDLPARAARIERRIKDAFAALAREIELIGDVRGRGVLLGIELVTDRETRAPANSEAKAVLEFCENAGLLLQLRGTGDRRNVLRLVPPMTTSDEDIDRGISILENAIRAAVGAAKPVKRAAKRRPAQAK